VAKVYRPAKRRRYHEPQSPLRVIYDEADLRVFLLGLFCKPEQLARLDHVTDDTIPVRVGMKVEKLDGLFVCKHDPNDDATVLRYWTGREIHDLVDATWHVTDCTDEIFLRSGLAASRIIADAVASLLSFMSDVKRLTLAPSAGRPTPTLEDRCTTPWCGARAVVKSVSGWPRCHVHAAQKWD